MIRTVLSAGMRLGRWTLEVQLGQGCFGTTWRARDVDGQLVALKVQDGPAEDEVRALARIYHPSVPSLRDAQGAPVPFLAMELAEGRPLSRMMRTGPAPQRSAMQVMAVLADALAAVHQAGLAHGDVKPDNVLVESISQRRIWLVDFGSSTGGGTLQYASPERLSGGPPTPAADVYALGLLAWEMLWGQLPGAEGGPAHVLMSRRQEVPRPPGGPTWLGELLERMLAIEPALRPSADDVADVLVAHGISLPDPDGEQLRRRARTAHVPRPEAEEAIQRWVEDGGLLLVQGELGCGRSHHLERAAAELRARGAFAVRIRAGGLPWSGISLALQDLSLPRAPVQLPEAADPQDRADAAAWELESRTPTGLYVLVDDLDEVDSGTLLVLRTLARRGRAALLCTARHVVDWISRTVELPSFDAELMEQLVVQILGDHCEARRIAEWLQVASAGNPDLAIHLLAEACRHRAIVRRHRRWLLDEELLAEVVSSAAQTAVAPAMGEDARLVGGILAIIGRSVVRKELLALAEMDEPRLHRAVQSLIDLGLLVSEDGALRCASPAVGARLQQACTQLREVHARLVADFVRRGDLSAPRLGWHLVGAEDAERAASLGPEILGQLRQIDLPEAARLVERLWRLSRDPHLGGLTVELMSQTGRTSEAEALAREALERIPAGRGRLPFLFALAQQEIQLRHRPERALELLEQASLVCPGHNSLKLTLLRAQAYHHSGQRSQAIAEAMQAVPIAPTEAEELDCWLGVNAVRINCVYELGDAQQALNLLDGLPQGGAMSRHTRLTLQATRGRLLLSLGRNAEAAEASERTAREPSVPAINRARALNNAAMARYGMGDRVRALEQWEEALLLFERIDARIEWVRVSNNLCLGYVELGRWERSRQAGLQAWEGARELGVAELEASSGSNLSELALCEGRWDECLTWIERSRLVALRIGMQEELAELHHRVAMVSAMRESPDAAERAREAEVLARSLGLIELAARSLALRGLACAQSGDREGMRICLSQSLTELRQAQAECAVHQVRLISARAAYRLREYREAVADCDRVALYAREKGLIAMRDQAESLHQLARQRIPATDQEARLDCLLRLAVAVARERDRDTLLDTIAAAGLELLDGQRSYVVLLQEGLPRVVAARYASPSHHGDPSMTIMRKCLSGGGEIIAPDLDERQMSQTSSLLVMNVRWVMCVPMADRGAVVGAIYVDSCNVTQQVLNESLRFMRALAAHAATAYANYRHLEELGRRAEQARDVAHDLRAPVAGIMSLASELRQPMANLELRYQLIDTIQLLAQRAMTLAEGYLRDRNSQPIDMDLQPLIASHCLGLHRLARDHGIELVSRSGAPLVVNADPDDMGRALANLVTNAIKFSPAGTAIRVVAEEHEGQALISVRDQGPGIPSDLLHHLFERGRAGQGPGSGHGLGLSIVRRLVEANRGRVHAFNLAQGGAEFQIVLPLRAAEVEDMAAR